jgi:hypothetical protein
MRSTKAYIEILGTRRESVSRTAAGHALTGDKMSDLPFTTFSTDALLCTLGVARPHETPYAD